MLCSTLRIFSPWGSQTWGWDGATSSGVALTSVNVLVGFIPGALGSYKGQTLRQQLQLAGLGKGCESRDQSYSCCRALTVSTITHNICLVSGCKVTDSSGDYTALRTDGKTSIINNYCNKCCIEVITNLTSQWRERTESNFNEMQVYTIIIFSWLCVIGPGNRFRGNRIIFFSCAVILSIKDE